MFTPTEALDQIAADLAAIHAALRPDAPPIAHIEALDRLEATLRRAVRRELLTSADADRYLAEADEMIRQVEAPAAPPVRPQGWASPEAVAATSDCTSPWEDELEALALTDAEIEEQLARYTSADLHRFAAVATRVAARRLACGDAIAFRSNVVPFPVSR